MSELSGAPASRIDPYDRLAAVTGALFVGACVFTTLGGLEWVFLSSIGAPAALITAVEGVTLALTLAGAALLMRSALRLAANGFTYPEKG